MDEEQWIYLTPEQRKLEQQRANAAFSKLVEGIALNPKSPLALMEKRDEP